MSTLIGPRAGTTPNARTMRGYLLIVAGIALSVVLLFVLALSDLPADDNAANPDHFSQIARNGASNWYRNFGGRYLPQIQDQDIFYSNIGSSVSAAKNADIVFLGPSFVSYAVDRDTLRASPPLSKAQNLQHGLCRDSRWRIFSPCDRTLEHPGAALGHQRRRSVRPFLQR